MGEAKQFTGWASGGSRMVHGAIIVDLVVASYLLVEPMAQPRLTLPLFVPAAFPKPSGTSSSTPTSAGVPWGVPGGAGPLAGPGDVLSELWATGAR